MVLIYFAIKFMAWCEHVAVVDLTAITSGGAIPENGLFSVIAEPDGIDASEHLMKILQLKVIGAILFYWALLLGKLNALKVSGRVIVEDAHGAPPSVPFWRGEAPGRTVELS